MEEGWAHVEVVGWQLTCTGKIGKEEQLIKGDMKDIIAERRKKRVRTRKKAGKYMTCDGVGNGQRRFEGGADAATNLRGGGEVSACDWRARDQQGYLL